MMLKNPSFESSESNLQRSKHQKMSQFHLGENNGSSSNNPFNHNTGLNSSDTNSFNNTNNACNLNPSSADETTEIPAWLSPLEPRIRHQDIRAHRVRGVGGWFLQTEEYQNWFNGIHGGESNNSTLFCYGDPGVGKTYIR